MMIKSFDELMYSHNPLEKIAFKMDVWSEIETFLKAEKEKRLMILCSVRKARSEDEQEVLDDAINNGEKGKVSYIPFRHTQQTDPNKGLTICNTTNYMILQAGKVRLQQRDEGEGYMFDLGAAIMYEKPIEFISTNSKDPIILGFLDAMVQDGIKREHYLGLPEDMENILQNNTYDVQIGTAQYFKALQKRREIIKNKHLTTELKYDSDLKLDKWSLLHFGMVNAALKIYPDKEFTLLNIDNAIKRSEFENNQKPKPISKSYTKVALITHLLYKGKHIDDILKQQYLLTLF